MDAGIVKDFLKKIIPERLRPLIKTGVLKLAYYGKKYYCPVCRSNVRKFKPCGYDFPVIYEMQIVGSGLRKTMCPVCGSSDRIRLLFLYLSHNTSLFIEPTKLLHIAPEKPLMDILIRQKNVDYLTADLNPENVMVEMDITKIRSADQTFNAIICNHVLEHIPDDRKAMSELYRVLKPGGWAVLQVPISQTLEETFEDFNFTSPEDREKYFGQKDHVRIYGKDYSQRLIDVGFGVEEFKWNSDHRFISEKNNYGLNENEVIFICTKKVQG